MDNFCILRDATNSLMYTSNGITTFMATGREWNEMSFKCRERGEGVSVLHRLQHDYTRSQSHMVSTSAFQMLKLKHECLGTTFVVIVVSGMMTWNPDANVIYSFPAFTSSM